MYCICLSFWGIFVSAERLLIYPGCNGEVRHPHSNLMNGPKNSSKIQRLCVNVFVILYLTSINSLAVISKYRCEWRISPSDTLSTLGLANGRKKASGSPTRPVSQPTHLQSNSVNRRDDNISILRHHGISRSGGSF